MSVRPYRDIVRRKSRQIHVGDLPVGGDAPISVQSMTNTPTADVAATVAQVRALEAAGADIHPPRRAPVDIAIGANTHDVVPKFPGRISMQLIT